MFSRTSFSRLSYFPPVWFADELPEEEIRQEFGGSYGVAAYRKPDRYRVYYPPGYLEAEASKAESITPALSDYAKEVAQTVAAIQADSINADGHKNDTGSAHSSLVEHGVDATPSSNIPKSFDQESANDELALILILLEAA